jgi:hypothetical protein
MIVMWYPVGGIIFLILVIKYYFYSINNNANLHLQKFVPSLINNQLFDEQELRQCQSWQ